MKTLKKRVLLLAITIITMLCMAVSASAAWEKFDENTNIEYYFDEVTATLHIRGEGKIPDDLTGRCVYQDDFEDSWDELGDVFETGEDYSTLGEMFRQVKTLIIEEGITEIGHCAFVGSIGYTDSFINLKTVVLPESLKVIDEAAFYNCEKLSKINLPEGLEYIHNEAFYDTNLKNVRIPESVIKIGNDVFDYCDNLKKVTFTKAVCTITACASLEEIVYPIDYTDFNRYSAYFMAQTCPNLKKITFPSVEKKHNIKISTEDYNIFVKDCPNVTLGYVNYDMIKNQYIDYAVITESVSKLGKVTGLKHKQKGDDNKLTWSPVDGAGYYKVYHYDEYNKKWVRVYCGAETYTSNISGGRYKVRAVNYDGKKYVYGKYSDEIELNSMYTVNLVVPETTSNSVTLRWSNTVGQTGFQLYYSTDRDSGYKKVVTTTKRKHTVKGLEKGKTYYFKVRRYYKYPDGNIAYGSFSIIREVTL